jgi:hypothetical protein
MTYHEKWAALPPARFPRMYRCGLRLIDGGRSRARGNRRAATETDMCGCVEVDPGGLENGGSIREMPASQRLDPGYQLPKRKWPDEVVACARLETAYAVIHRVSCGEHEDWCAGRGGAGKGRHLEAECC